MNSCYDCILQGVWKNRIGNAILIVSKNKISKNIRIFLNKFRGYVCALSGFICLKVINFFHDFITFSLRETKRKTDVVSHVVSDVVSHVVSVAPISSGMFFYHSFHGMTSKISLNQGKGAHFYV